MHDDAHYWDSFAGHALDAAVIDPNDMLGHKNAYISQLRNEALIETLSDKRVTGPVLDFGCGTGGLSAALSDAGFQPIGIDISLGLLKRCKDRDTQERISTLQFDGYNIPLADQSIEAAATYIVLMYISDELLSRLLREISRILKADGHFVVMEQFRRRQKMIEKDGKLHRSVDDFIRLAEAAGLSSESRTVCRYGHFPCLYAIRYGLVPQRFFSSLRAMERGLGRLFGVLPWDYTDVRIVFSKQSTVRTDRKKA